MSTNRSNSQVRNLRAMFENNAPPSRTSIESSSPERGRSNGHLSPGPNGERPLSRVRSSFVSVEPTVTMEHEIDPEKTKQEYGVRHGSTASFRRESFSLDEMGDSGQIAELKKTISQESQRRSSNPSVSETIPEAAIEATPAATPAVEAKDYMAAGQYTGNEKSLPHSKLRDVITPGITPGGVGPVKDSAEQEPSKRQAQTQPQTQTQTEADDDLPADNPDKPVSGLQGEPGPMQPSDLKDRAAVSPVASPAPDPSPAPEQAETETETGAGAEAEAEAKEQEQPVPAAAFSAAAPAQSTPRARRGTLSAVDVPGAASSSTVPVAVDPPTPVSAPHTDAAPAQKTPSPKRPTHIDLNVNKSPEQQQQPKTPTSAKKAPSSAKPSPASSALSSKPSAKNLAAASSKSNSPQSKPIRQRSPTRPAKVPSHLTAPTASSAAKHDAQSTKPTTAAPKPAPSTTKPVSTTTKPAPTTRTQPRASSATSKSAPRSSVAPTTTAPAKKPEPRSTASAKGPDDSFLARMMRPTASSASKVHDRTEVKSPPKRTPSVVRPKGVVKPKTAKIEKPTTNGSKPASSSSNKEPTEAPKSEAGVSTPQASSGAQVQEQQPSLEATPAFDTATIR